MFKINFKFKNLIVSGFMMIFPLISFSQMTQQWAHRQNGSEYVETNGTKMDASGNLYVACSGYNTTSGYYIMLSKYSSASTGSPLWTATYLGITGESELASALVLDNLGNIYITGQILGPNSLIDAITLKYNNNGSLQWSVRYNNSYNGYDRPTCLTVDPSGNVIVGGITNTAAGYPYNYLILKYNNSGVQQWIRTYDGPSTADDDDVLSDITSDASGNIYVTGKAGWTNTGYDIVNLRITPAGVLGATRYDGAEHSDDMGKKIVVDGAGNYYVTGSTIESGVNPEITTLKFSPANVPLWTVHYDYAIDSPNDMKMDNAGNIYVAGYTKNGNVYSFVTLKYNSNGALSWSKRNSGGEVANSLAIDGQSNVYVTGHFGQDIATVKYNQNGTQVGNVMIYDGSSNERGATVISNNSGSAVYVTGLSFTPQNQDVVIIKYTQLVGISSTNSEIPERYSLEQNYPNPFNPSTKIKFSVPAESNVKIKVYDIMGKEVAVVADENMKAGNYEINFDASSLSSGTYFYNLETDGFSATKKMILAK